MLSRHASFDPKGSYQKPLAELQAPHTKQMQDFIVKGNYVVLNANIFDDNFIAFELKIQNEKIKGIFLITRPKDLYGEKLNVSNFVSAYLYVNDIRNTKNEDKLDLNLEGMQNFKEKVLAKIKPSPGDSLVRQNPESRGPSGSNKRKSRAYEPTGRALKTLALHAVAI